jgi:hypothetical protein
MTPGQPRASFFFQLPGSCQSYQSILGQEFPALENLQKPQRDNRAEINPGLMLPGGFPLRGFQGVHFLHGFLGFFLDDMGGQVAVPAGPFGIGIGTGDAEFPAGENLYALAAFASLDDGIALSPVITAPLLGHEGAIHANFDYLTDHFCYLLKK